MEVSPKDEYIELEEKVLYRRSFRRMLLSIAGLVSVTVLALFFQNYFEKNFIVFIVMMGIISLRTILNSIQYKFIYHFKIEPSKVIFKLINLWGQKKTMSIPKEEINKLALNQNELVIDTSRGKKKFTLLASELEQSELKQIELE